MRNAHIDGDDKDDYIIIRKPTFPQNSFGSSDNDKVMSR